jgi:hypothetical protein
MVEYERPAHTFSAVVAKHLRLWVLMAAVVAMLLPVGNAAWADEGDNGGGAVRLLKTIPVPVRAGVNNKPTISPIVPIGPSILSTPKPRPS